TCQVSVPVAGVTVTAAFDRLPLLNVTPPSGGTVTGPAISCPPTCTASYPTGQQVTLTATPRQFFLFTGWGGACSRTATMCSLTMDGAKTVSAGFRDGAAAEDCVSHDPNNLQVVQNGQRFQLVDSGVHLMATFNTGVEAQNAM